MGKQVSQNWQAIQVLFCQGITPSALEKQFGVAQATISQRARRNGWKALASQTAQIASAIVAKKTIDDMASMAKTFKQEAADDALKTLRALAKKDPENLGWLEAEARERIASSVTKRGACVFGFANDDNRTVINVALLSDACAQERETQCGHTIDVNANKIEERQDEANLVTGSES